MTALDVHDLSIALAFVNLDIPEMYFVYIRPVPEEGVTNTALQWPNNAKLDLLKIAIGLLGSPERNV